MLLLFFLSLPFTRFYIGPPVVTTLGVTTAQKHVVTAGGATERQGRGKKRGNKGKELHEEANNQISPQRLPPPPPAAGVIVPIAVSADRKGISAGTGEAGERVSVCSKAGFRP